MDEPDPPPLADDAALGALEARSVTLLHTVTSAVVWIGGREVKSRILSTGPDYRGTEIVEAPPHRLARASVARSADELGFRYVGTTHEGITPVGIASDAWVAPDETAYLVGTQARSKDPIVEQLSAYFIVTVFDDGTCVETAASKAASEQSGDILMLRGTNRLDADWAAHRAEVAKHCTGRGCRVIAVRDHATILRLKRLYFRQLVSRSTAKIILGMFAAMATVFFVLLGLILRVILR